ncbi:MAG: hypothetical protein JXA01_02780 [Dehalococcoidia bacterium]|nr:hypothetical protein [Dehalococcoidia bacterium]
MVKQIILTPAAGKRLIGKALSNHPEIAVALQKGTIVIVAGTTNGYVAEEILSARGQLEGFSRNRFFRGVTLPPTYSVTEKGRMHDESAFPGDVVIKDGSWLKGKTLMDVLGDLKEGDIILKGANALDLSSRCAAVLVGHPKGGTVIAALQAMVGRRVRLILPVGLEKRVTGDLYELAARINSPGEKGKRLLPVPGEVFTEIEAFHLLTGATAELMAGGGVCGAEGCVWLHINGTPDDEQATEQLLKEVVAEPRFTI